MKINISNKLLGLLLSLLVIFPSLAEMPEGYYNNAIGKNGSVLKTACYNIIKNHTSVSYDYLWTAFKKTDARADGKVWDMYSSITNYTFGSNQCGNYKGEGDCYNREHSFPKSWFNDKTPMYSDLFHLYPTDGYVNGRRSNYAFGEVGQASYTSANGTSKLGTCDYPGCTESTVFEPDDEYKGDFARTYFYMATRYENLLSGWNSPMMDGSSYPAYKTWAINMFLEWNTKDPVSPKEKNRNEEVYKIQKIRNPFIDYPNLAEHIWGKLMNVPFDGTSSLEESANDYTRVFVTPDGRLSVTDAPANSLLYIYNVSGVLVNSYTLHDEAEEFEISSPGVYIIKVTAPSVNHTVKVVVH